MLSYMTVRLRRDYYFRLLFLGVLLGGLALLLALLGYPRHPSLVCFGLVPFISWFAIAAWNYRRSPRCLDARSITRHDDERYEWADLLQIDRVRGRAPSGEIGPLNHLKLRFRYGIVTIFPFTLDNAAAIVQAVESAERRQKCAICPQLGEYNKGFQKGGGGTRLPAAASSLRTVRELDAGKNPAPVLQQCPQCLTYYLYETECEFLVSGREGQQTLSRLTDEAALKYLT